jgi:aspartyl-tRNA(Asn)/glutamyl-tRNA(Gln) amidotransferase subunit C
MISRDEVLHVARLSRLHLTDDEVERMRQQLDAILAYVDKLRELDVEGIEPTAHAVPLVNVMRDDALVPSLSQEQALSNAPDRAEEFFRVPRIIED